MGGQLSMAYKIIQTTKGESLKTEPCQYSDEQEATLLCLNSKNIHLTSQFFFLLALVNNNNNNNIQIAAIAKGP